MIKDNECYLKFKLRKCLNSMIDVLITQELKANDLENEVKQVTKSILPNADAYLTSVICNYAKTKQSIYSYEKILCNEINKYERALSSAIDEYKIEVAHE